ncbi:DNA repair protein RecO [Bacteroidales bacterium OttesenSCG-928-A17]|nr:DNA repair protein RecO [Bacteroidales bacterium OttesenSCG-928-A17]
MLHKTRGLVLHNRPYSDVYSIVLIYTEEFGPVSYLVPRSRGKKSSVSKSLFYPLAILDLEVDHQNLREIQRIKEAKIHFASQDLLQDPIKSSIGIFLAEFLSKILREVHPNSQLFIYLTDSIRVLDMSRGGYANFHLSFMINLTRFMGFTPDADTYAAGAFFDMQNGVFVSFKPASAHFLNPDESLVFHHLLRINYNNMRIFRFSGRERKLIIDRILEYYRIHLVHFPDIKSLDILHEVFG